MLVKSKKSAVIMGIIFGIPVITIAFVVGEIRYFLLSPAERNPNAVNGFTGIVPALMCGAIALVSLGLVSLVIYQLNEFHFGRQGAVRWAIAGTIYGLLQQVILTPIPAGFDFKLASIRRQIGGDLLWKGLAFVFSYVLAFPLFTLFQNWRRKLRKG
jgi:peptidoglycan/LPS O-acetylase OafA/YrhL